MILTPSFDQLSWTNPTYSWKINVIGHLFLQRTPIVSTVCDSSPPPNTYLPPPLGGNPPECIFNRHLRTLLSTAQGSTESMFLLWEGFSSLLWHRISNPCMELPEFQAHLEPHSKKGMKEPQETIYLIPCHEVRWTRTKPCMANDHLICS